MYLIAIQHYCLPKGESAVAWQKATSRAVHLLSTSLHRTEHLSNCSGQANQLSSASYDLAASPPAACFMNQLNFLLSACVAFTLAAPAAAETADKEITPPHLYAFATNARKYGYKTAEGKVIVPAELDFPSARDGSLVLHEGKSAAFKNGNLIYLNECGKTVLETSYKNYGHMHQFSEQRAVVSSWNTENKSLRFGYINQRGELAIPFEFIEAGDFSSGFALVLLPKDPASQTKDLAFVDKSGQLHQRGTYLQADGFSEGLARVHCNGHWAFINTNFEIEFTTSSTPIGTFKEGLVRYKTKDGLFGYMDKTGTVVIPASYLQAEPFCDGLAAVKVPSPGTDQGRKSENAESGRWGFIDKSASWIIAPVYDQAQSFSEGKSFVGYKRKTFCIDRRGKKLFSTSVPVWMVTPFTHDLAMTYRTEIPESSYEVFIDAQGKPNKFLGRYTQWRKVLASWKKYVAAVAVYKLVTGSSSK